MRLPCAWCESEVKPALIAEVESRENPTPTHGMCPTHRAQVEEELTRHREELAQHREEHRKEIERLRAEVDALREKVDP